MEAKVGKRSSWGWKGIIQGRRILERGKRWRVGNGNCIRVHQNPWLPRPHTFRPRSRHPEMPTRVCDLIDANSGAWKTGLIRQCFDMEEGNLILGLPISMAGCKDRIIWHYTSNGEYSTRTGYRVAMEMQENGEFGRKGTGGSSRRDLDDKRWLEVWKLNVPNKMKFLIWRCCNTSLAVRANLLRRRMRVDPTCALCGVERETEQHLFFECEFSKLLWFGSSLQTNLEGHTGTDFCESWQGLCNRFRDNEGKETILQECVFIMWRIWKYRNALVFRGEGANPMDGITLVRQQLWEYRAAQPKHAQAEVNEGVGETETFAGNPVRWKRPSYGVIKVNCDGAWCKESLRGGFGWVVRDFAGLLLLAGGEGNMFFNNAIMAEAAAVRAALTVCRESGFEDVEIETDSQTLVKMLNCETMADATLDCFIHDIGFLASQLGRVRFLFVKRNGNAAAHAVASYVTSKRGSFRWDAFGPEFLFNTLAEDVNISIRL